MRPTAEEKARAENERVQEPVPRIHATLAVYIGRHVLVALLATLGVIMGLILLMDTIDMLRRASGYEVAVGTLFTMALLRLPPMMQEVLPFVVLIGSMIAMWRLTRSQELVVMRSVGVSVWQVLAPALLVVAVFGILNVIAFNPLAAASVRTFQAMEDRIFLNRTSSIDLSSGGLWLREPRPDGGHVVVHAAHVRQDGYRLDMRDLSFLFVDSGDRFVRRMDARLGSLEDGRFRLESVRIMEPNEMVAHRDTLVMPTSLTLARVQDKFAVPESLSFWELPGFIAFFESAGFSARAHRLYWYGLIASPVLLCAMTLMAAVFSVNPNTRSGRGLMHVIGGIGVGFLIYFFSRLTLALGTTATLPPLLAAWSPTVITILLGVAALLHLEDG